MELLSREKEPDHQTNSDGGTVPFNWNLGTGWYGGGGTLLLMAGWVNKEKKEEQDKRAEQGEEETHTLIISSTKDGEVNLSSRWGLRSLVFVPKQR